MRIIVVILIASLLALAVIAHRHSRPAGLPPAASPTNSAQQIYFAKGLIKEIPLDRALVKIQHETIPGYMEAMTMPFTVKNTNELNGLKAGDLVTFNLVVTPDTGWIEKVVKIGVQTVPAPEPVRVVRDVELLKEGDALPNYQFTNEFAQPMQLSQFKGQALVLAFFYTRCPFPDFCPRTSSHLAETVKRMKALPGGPTNWHVLSLSFDPAFDTVAALKAYSGQYQADPQRWNFLTGKIEDIDAITEQFGLMAVRSENGFDHNLRTVVIDAHGVIRRIITGNTWKPEELVTEVVKALN